MNDFDLDIEPEEMRLTLEPDALTPGDPEAALFAVNDGRAGNQQMALVQSLPSDFPLTTLLRFLPDVRLKRELDQDATAALAINIVGPAAMQQADESLLSIRTQISNIKECFAEPTDLANQLHKRLTGLRADFIRLGEQAIETVGRRIYTEKRRLDQVAEDARRQAQAVADQLARDNAKKAAEEAARRNAPVAVIDVMQQMAEVIKAAPVLSPAPAPVLQHTTTMENWKAQLVGTESGEDPNPDVVEMSPAQIVSFKKLLQAVINGTQPLTLVDINWTVANVRAKSDQKTLAIDGLEAIDIGGVRGKGRRK